MYAGLLLATGCLALGAKWVGLCWLPLLLVLWIKLRREEQLLCAKWPEYADYMKRSKRLIPWVV